MTATNQHPFHQWVRLEQPKLGTRVVFATDEFFGAKERLIGDKDPVFIPDKYDDHGKWMDGWESRRKREAGHDWCIVKLGIPGVVHGLDIDTSHFSGNQPPFASVEACSSEAEIPTDVEWRELHSRVALDPDAHHLLAIDDPRAVSHLRLNIYPDGGVARLRIYGEVRRDWRRADVSESIDLLALENGGRALCCSDEHFGSMHNLNAPGRGVNMGDGWETARRRGPGNDWVILKLGQPGTIEKVIIDTAHFKGNYPDRAAIQAAMAEGADIEMFERESEGWPHLLRGSKLEADIEHTYTSELHDLGPVSHLKLSIFPDGGVSRLRVYGRLSRQKP